MHRFVMTFKNDSQVEWTQIEALLDLAKVIVAFFSAVDPSIGADISVTITQNVRPDVTM